MCFRLFMLLLFLRVLTSKQFFFLYKQLLTFFIKQETNIIEDLCFTLHLYSDKY